MAYGSKTTNPEPRGGREKKRVRKQLKREKPSQTSQSPRSGSDNLDSITAERLPNTPGNMSFLICKIE